MHSSDHQTPLIHYHFRRTAYSAPQINADRQLQIPLCRPVCVSAFVWFENLCTPSPLYEPNQSVRKGAFGVLITTEPGMSLILPMRQLHTPTGLGDGGENLCLILIPFSCSTKKKKKTKKKQKETLATDTVTQQCNGFALQENRLQSKHTATVVEEGRRQHKKSYKQPTDTLTMLAMGWVGSV